MCLSSAASFVEIGFFSLAILSFFNSDWDGGIGLRSKCLGWTVAFVFHLYFCILYLFVYFICIFVFFWYLCICDSKFKVTVATQGCGQRVSGGGKHLSLYSVHCIQYTLYSICIYTLYNICNYTLYSICNYTLYSICIYTEPVARCFLSLAARALWILARPPSPLPLV